MQSSSSSSLAIFLIFSWAVSSSARRSVPSSFMSRCRNVVGQPRQTTFHRRHSPTSLRGSSGIRSFASVDPSQKLPKGLKDAIQISTDNLAKMKDTDNVLRVVLKRGPMLDSPKEELKVIHEISANFVEKANIKNARLVVTKPEIADFLRGAVREVPELEIVDLSSDLWCKDENIGALIFATLDEFTSRPAKLAAKIVQGNGMKIPIVVANPSVPWRSSDSKLFERASTETAFFMEQGLDKETGTVMVTNMGDGIWQAWNIIWSPTGGDYSLLLTQDAEPSTDEVVAAVFDVTKQQKWDEVWGGLLDTFNVKGESRDKVMGFFQQNKGRY